MNRRDYDYIEVRLLSPCTEAIEAAGRLSQVGLTKQEKLLRVAIADFTDKCRAIRHEMGWRP